MILSDTIIVLLISISESYSSVDVSIRIIWFATDLTKMMKGKKSIYLLYFRRIMRFEHVMSGGELK